MTWQPIETAPKDATIILWRPTLRGFDVGRWNDMRFNKKPTPYWESHLPVVFTQQAKDHAPTHWMPFPEPPEVL